ncbi:hypothetical protein [Streptomyces cellostaticus]|uniref:hypothetical protein n=1 Tax=Streptomyces cellostaticus TaxID=67285 RepID=UPI000AB44C63|nr:hypothetical protein [Streptomyces cellostaticus]
MQNMAYGNSDHLDRDPADVLRKPQKRTFAPASHKRSTTFDQGPFERTPMAITSQLNLT